MYVKISSFLIMFSGLIPSSLVVSSEFLGELWEGLKVGLCFIISKLFGTGSKSSLSDTDSGIVCQCTSSFKIRESRSIAPGIIIVK